MEEGMGQKSLENHTRKIDTWLKAFPHLNERIVRE